MQGCCLAAIAAVLGPPEPQLVSRADATSMPARDLGETLPEGRTLFVAAAVSLPKRVMQGVWLASNARFALRLRPWWLRSGLVLKLSF